MPRRGSSSRPRRPARLPPDDDTKAISTDREAVQNDAGDGSGQGPSNPPGTALGKDRGRPRSASSSSSGPILRTKRRRTRLSVSRPKSRKGRRQREAAQELADIVDNSSALYPETAAAKQRRIHEKGMKRYRRDRARKNPDGVAVSTSSPSIADEDRSSSSAARAARVSSMERALRPDAQPNTDDEDFIDDEGVEDVVDDVVEAEFTDDADDDADADVEGSWGTSAARHRTSTVQPRHRVKTEEQSFKDVVQWMVQKALNPASNRGNPKFGVAFEKFDSRFQTCASSAYGSDAWKNDLTLALKARPFYDAHPIEARAGCEACHRPNHTAVFRVRLRGTPYNIDTFELLSRNDVDAQGRVIPSHTTTWCIGKYCKVNTENSHELCHWRHTLWEDVRGYLTRKRYFSDDKIAEREAMRSEKRRHEVYEVVQRLVAEGELSNLLKKNMKMLDKARAAKMQDF